MTLMLETEIKPNTRESANWSLATTLAERTATGWSRNLKSNTELAKSRLGRWCSQSPLNNETIFEQWLVQNNLSKIDLLNLLGESSESLQTRLGATLGEWVEDLESALALEHFQEIEAELPPAKNLESPNLNGILSLVKPFIVQTRRRLHAELATIAQIYKCVPTDLAKLEELLLQGLAIQLIEKLSPVVVTELHVARLQGKLVGDSPEARFINYTRSLSNLETIQSIFGEYPVLARQLVNMLQNWVDFRLDFVRHLCSDWAELNRIFKDRGDLGELVALSSSLGDGHRRGKTVLMAKFSSGVKLVYKPRSLDVDLHFQELLQWVNTQGNATPFRSLNILSRADHGWVEFIEAADCTTIEQIQRFYKRQGGYLALLYMLGATDFHYQNLIASGEHPYLVDLEALFHPFIATSQDSDKLQASNVVGELISYSVLRIGLLPNRVSTNKGEADIEVSGLGGSDGQLSLHPLPYWENAGTDEMRMATKRREMAPNKNRPTLNGKEVNLLDYSEAITAGFINTYQLLVAHRDELLANDGPLTIFSQDEVRVVLRATQTYELLMRHSNRPDKLRNALDREPIFNKLWLEAKQHPYLARVIAAERFDLQQDDIPIFTTRPASHHIWTSTEQVVENFLREPGLVSVQRRLQRMGQADLNQQLWFIRASLTTFVTTTEHNHAVNPFTAADLTENLKVERAELLEAACAIGNRLEELALRGDDDATWMGLTLERLNRWSLTPLNLNLYDGLTGVTLFLAYLGYCTNEARYNDLAEAALLNIQRQLEAHKSINKMLGSMEGWGSVIYTFTHLGVLWHKPALLDDAMALALEVIPPLIEEDNYLDVITGSAGCIGVLVNLYRHKPDARILELALKCGEHLLVNAQPQTTGVGWRTFMPATQAATGFGRGSTGMGWALLKLANISGEVRFRNAGVAAIAYERSVFVGSESNWPDYRTAGKAKLPKGQLRFMTAWCHGAPGIGLARLSLLSELPEDASEIQLEIDAALKNTFEQGFGFNHSLCHGDLGNVDFILEAGLVRQDAQLLTKANQIVTVILAGIKQHGWICSTPLDVETPGLLVGLAGIGYGLLRLAAPEIVPSVLVLQPPKESVIGG